MTDIPVLTVSQLTREIKHRLEGEFPAVVVTGEISNFTRAASGHCYLTLKDDSAQLRAIIWRGMASRLRFELENGLEVVAAGRLEVYEARGAYQLIIEQCEPLGVGALELAFQQLRDKLAAEGLFEPEHKQPLPAFPRRIALITSPTSAAVRDMLQVLTRRWRGADILIVPVAVQGQGAAEEIAAAVRTVSNMDDIDVIITGRGGGSLEDLWAFNEEVVARAIFDCQIPVVSAVGHEIDVTIADLVADRRALTPSEAGELVVPDALEVGRDFDRLRERLVAGLRQRATSARTSFNAVATRRVFTHPTERVHALQQQLDDLDTRARRAIVQILREAGQKLAAHSGSLEALSPLAVLQRGYSLTRDETSGALVRRIADIEPGNMLQTLIPDGCIRSKVESIETGDPRTFLK